MNNKSTNIISRNRKETAAPAKKRSTVVASKKAGAAHGRRRTISSNGAIQYVLPLGNGWVVKSNHAITFTAITYSKREAISIARNIARTKKTGLIGHGKRGNVEIQESYAV